MAPEWRIAASHPRARLCRGLPEIAPLAHEAQLLVWRFTPMPDAATQSRLGWSLILDWLAARLAQPRQALQLVRTANGKPQLAACPWAFSIAHVPGCTVLGISQQRCLGIDLVARRPLQSGMRLARRLLRGPALLAWRKLPAEARHDALLSRFAAIEATVKALDLRLWQALADVHLDTRLQRAQVRSQGVQRHLHLLPLQSSGHQLLLATPRPLRRVHLLEIQANGGDPQSP